MTNLANEWLNYHHLFYFHTVVLSGSLFDAAEKLSLGQAALSIQIKKLEESLGQPLFDRNKKRLSLNETGRLVFEYTSQIFRLGAEMKDALRDRTVVGKTGLQVGVSDQTPRSHIREWLQPSMYKPDIQMTVCRGSHEWLLAELSAHRLDLVLSHSAALSEAGAEGYTLREISREELTLYVVDGHSEEKRNKNQSELSLHKIKSKTSSRVQNVEDLAQYKWFLPIRGTQERAQIEQYFVDNKMTPPDQFEVNDVDLMFELFQSQGGACFLNSNYVQVVRINKKYREVKGWPRLEKRYWIWTEKRKVSNPAAAQLINSIIAKTVGVSTSTSKAD